MSKLFNFVKLRYNSTESWWLKIPNEYELNHYFTHFARSLYEKSFTNLIEGKEYDAPNSFSHGPYVGGPSSLSYTAYIRARAKNRPLPFGALEELGYIRNEQYKDMLEHIKNEELVYVNKEGGYQSSKDPLNEVCSLFNETFPN